MFVGLYPAQVPRAADEDSARSGGSALTHVVHVVRELWVVLLACLNLDV